MRSGAEATKKITVIAVLTAIAYAVMFVIHIPVSFLTYDPKAVVIAIGGLLYGPGSALLISVAVGLAEMVTISGTGPIGALMNILATAFFACPAAWIYKKRRSVGGAYVGLGVGLVLSTIVMLLLNYLLTPLYLDTTREKVVEMIVSLLLPFNLIKAGINAAATALLYKPIALALRKARLLPKAPLEDESRPRGPEVAVHTRKRFLWLGAAGALLVFLGVLFWFRSTL